MKISEQQDQLTELENAYSRSRRELNLERQHTQQLLDQAITTIEYMEGNTKKKKQELQRLTMAVDDSEVEHS